MINEKEMPFWKAVIPLIVMIVVMGITIIKLEQGPHVPLIVGTTVAAIVALSSGFKWKDIEESMYKGIRLALPAVVIIMLVGITIGAWIGGGIVATMIYYGLKIITPSLFFSFDYDYLCSSRFSDRKFLVNNGNHRGSWHGNWS